MGTNYYRITAKWKKCPTCKKAFYWEMDAIHIGKSSMGWKFHFQYETFANPAEWKKEIIEEKWHIVDEYERPISRRAFIKMVENKQGTIEPPVRDDFGLWRPIEINGYLFFDEEWS